MMTVLWAMWRDGKCLPILRWDTPDWPTLYMALHTLGISYRSLPRALFVRRM